MQTFLKSSKVTQWSWSPESGKRSNFQQEFGGNETRFVMGLNYLPKFIDMSLRLVVFKVFGPWAN